MRRAISELLAGLVRRSGDELVAGLQEELAGAGSLEEGWRRLCETAWALGFVELWLEPNPFFAPSLAPRRASVPGGGEVVSVWSFDLLVHGTRAATFGGKRGRNGLEFDPPRLADAARTLVARFAAAAAGD